MNSEKQVNLNPYELYIQLEKLQGIWNSADNLDEQIFACAFTSIELALHQIESILKENRLQKEKYTRIDSLLEGISRQLTLTFQLTNDTSTIEQIKDPSSSSKFGILQTLPSDFEFQNSIIQSQLLGHLKIKNCCIGVLPMLNSEQKPQRFLAYDKIVQPDVINEIFSKQQVGTEDKLFQLIHQMTESWLFLTYRLLTESKGNLEQGRFDIAGQNLLRASKIMGFISSHVQNLDNMMLADYHRLRVQLRGASGAQSVKCFQVTRIAREIKDLFTKKIKCTILQIYEKPRLYSGEYETLEGLTNLENQIQTFLFHHYQLAKKTLGTKSIGSLGYEIEAMIKRFTQPLFQDIDDARYAHAINTGFAYGVTQGIYTQSLQQEKLRESKLLSKNQITINGENPENQKEFDKAYYLNLLNLFYKSINEFDCGTWVKTMDENGQIADPVGSKPFTGSSELDVFFKGLQKQFKKLTVETPSIYISKGQALVYFDAKALSYNDKQLVFQGYEFFKFNLKKKLIKSVDVYHNTMKIAAQLSDLYKQILPSSITTSEINHIISQGYALEKTKPAQKPRNILILTCPRSMSSLFLRIFMKDSRIDGYCDPISEAYFQDGRKCGDNYYRRINEMIKTMDENEKSGKITVIKEMSFILKEDSEKFLIDTHFKGRFSHIVYLVRNPIEACKSYYTMAKKENDSKFYLMKDYGYKDLWNHYKDHPGYIYFAEDLIKSPNDSLKDLLDWLQIDEKEIFPLNWEPMKQEAFPEIFRAWYQDALNSTTIRQNFSNHDKIVDQMYDDAVDFNIPYFRCFLDDWISKKKQLLIEF